MPRAPVRRITRFTVMATLQAARATRLGLPEGSALSWGLNRAIFYAAAKRGFRGAGAPAPPGEPSAAATGAETYSLGDDFAYRDPNSAELRFTIGGETQTEEAFHRQVAARFGEERAFREAWEEALELVGKFDEGTLRSGRRFYAEVYKPRRDELVAQWTERFLHEQAPAGATTGALTRKTPHARDGHLTGTRP